MKLLTTILLTLIFAAPSFAQTGGSISGTITQDTNTTVADATVSLISQISPYLSFTTVTDASGNYRFENVPSGAYNISASAVTNGRSNFSQKTAVTLAAGENTIINLNLEIYGGIREIVTISAGTQQNIDEVSKSVSVIQNEELENRNEISVADALRTVPGLRVQQLGGFGRTANIKTRGLRNQDTAVLIDGQRFRDPAAITGDASPFLSDLTVTNISRVEVLRGSGSSLYGTNAIGGVFNIITDSNGDSTPRISLLGEGGGLGLFRGKLNFAHRFRNFTYNFGVSHTNFDKGIDGDDAARNTSGQGRFSFAINENLSLSARFYASDAFVQLNSNPDTIGTLPATGIIDARPLSRDELRRRDRGQTITNIGDATFIPDVNDPDASQASRFFNFHTALDGIINKDATYRFSYQNLTTSRKNFNGPGGIGFQPFGGTSRSDFDGNIQTFQAKTNLTIRSNTVTIGYGFEREKIGNDNFFTDFMTPINATDAAQSSNTFIIQDQLEAFEKRLQLSGAFRAQFFNLGTPRFSSSNAPYQNLSLENPPNAYTFDGSAAYFFRSIGTKLRAHVGNGYRVPSLYERFGTFFATFVVPNRFVPLGAPDLEPERSLSVDGGIDQTFASNRVRLSATYFYTRLIDTIDFGTLEQPDRFGRSNSLSGGGYLNREGGISRGAEFSAEFKPTLSTDIFASYTFTNSDQRRAQVSGSGIIQTLGVPDHQFSFVATQRLGKRLTLNFDFVSTSSYLAPIFSNTSFRTRLYRFNGQRKGDLTAAYEIPTNSDKLRFRLFGTIENLFNQDYYENGFSTARATGRGGLQVNF